MSSNEVECWRAWLATGQYDDALKLLQKMCAQNSFVETNNFLETAKLVMSLAVSGSDDLKDAAGKVRLYQTLASKGGSEHANFLCDLGIVENSIEMLKLLHADRYDRSGKNERIILTIWTLFRDILRKSSKGQKRFMKCEGLHWISWYTGKYPIQKSKQLQILMEELVEILGPIVIRENAEKWTSCMESIQNTLKRIK